ncbi:uncharacterized protein LOC131226104 isoform X2 [Magnolia sinica]|uniref:uncharacterized protein LOC131226104 isoform X2 n=1 Tax=Magnolia sinica TaxID=86752 RepID=UPI00265AA401|nr:uncharacterized protein LOC131226104 isoform X2 [Magnolia sinica]
MPEKTPLPISTAHIFRSNSYLFKGLPSLTAALFIAVVIIWGIDSCTVRSWQNHRDYLGIQPATLSVLSTPPHNVTHRSNTSDDPTTSPSPQNLTHIANTTTTSPPQNMTHIDNSTTPSPPQNLTHNTQTVDRNSIHTPTLLSWISLKLEPNFTSNLLSQWLRPGGQPCLDNRSENIKIPALDGQNYIELPTGEIHEFIFSAYDGAGIQRCSGGDYFETDLSGDSWKSRPPVKDLGNGSYSISLQIHPDFAGEYDLTFYLLFRSFEGLKFSPERFAFRRQLRKIPIKFIRTSAKLPEIQTCRRSDFKQDIWSGRWTQHGKNNKCTIDDDGRYRCLKADYPCQSPWCDGSLGLLESNGWVYSAHCSFRIFTTDSAWKCLKNRWIFFWGDSNHVDTIRNLLNFVLGHPEVPAIPRRFDGNFTNPNDPSQSLRITSIFNGHWNHTMNYEGLNSLQNEGYRKLLKGYFSGKTVPDTMILNSGLHDGVHWKSIRAFSAGAEYAAKYWEEVLGAIPENRTKLFYRTTVATGGYARDLAFNPNKIEAFNLVLLEKLKDRGLLSGVIDNFDMTFPWHYDNRCNDGVHYGRGPAKLKWRDGIVGHQYFVDLMLGHVLLNAMCPGD